MLRNKKASENLNLIAPQNSKILIDSKSFSYSTLVCLLPFGDYQLLTLMIQIITLSVRQDQEMSAATSYMKSFYNICLLCLNSGILNALGSYGAQSCGVDSFKRYNCCLRQSIILSAVCFFVMGVCLSFFFEYFLIDALNIDDVTSHYT